ncbi:DNA repair exonuclease [Patescibacteria group bacterium]|nr:DNA repair exonuclease [Patescibacteria group bacterium]
MGKEVTFIHTSDIHLGRSFKYLLGSAKDAKDHLNYILFKIADIAISRRVDIIFISGDLFDKSDPDLNTVNKFIEFAEKLKETNIKVIILPGTHDFLSDNSIYKKVDLFKLIPNVYIFRDQDEFFFEDLSLSVYGIPPISNKTSASPITPFKKDDRALYHVIMAHGSVQIEGKSAKDDTPIEIEDIKNSFADYIALGHWHQIQDFSVQNVHCFYSGSPELIDLDQIKSGFIIYGNLKNKTFENIKVGEREFDELIIDLSSIESVDMLLTKVRKNSNANLIRKVILTGQKREELFGLDILELEDVAKSYFYFLKIEDKTYSDYKFDYPEDVSLVDKIYTENLLSQIENCKDESEKLIYKNALEEGIALLRGIRKL